jgi:hypothetical protein
MRRGAYVFLFIMVFGPPMNVSAEVVASGPGGFVVREEVDYHGLPDAAWQRLVRPQDWWDGAHTYSHDAANLSLTLVPGGCWCEKLANGGFVRHMDVTYVQAPVRLRLSGGLGPLQAMGVSGALTFTLKAGEPGTTKVKAEYAVSGFSADGFAKIAEGVDGVLGEQLQRFAASR